LNTKILNKRGIKMTKNICLKFATNSHYDLLRMHVPEDMEASEFLKIIEANELAECNHTNGHLRFKEHYRTSGELNNRSIYEVHTDNLDNSLKLIMGYRQKA